MPGDPDPCHETTAMPSEIASNAARFFLELGEYDEDDLKVLRFSSSEKISEMFSVAIEFASRDPELDFTAIIGAPAILGVATTGETRYLHGIGVEIEQTGATQGHTYYSATLRPKAWRLTQRTNCRIFQNMGVDGILKDIFRDHDMTGADVEFDLGGSCEPREFCVQYRETDYDFVSRLMEEEGMFFYFVSSATVSKIVVTDKGDSRPRIDGDDELRFAPTGGMTSEDSRDQIFDLQVKRQLVSDSYASRGRHIEKPHDMHDATVQLDGTKREIFEHLEDYDDVSVGSEIVERRLQEVLAQEILLTGMSNSSALVPGFEFDLTEHPRASFNGPYHITEFVMSGASPQSLEEDMATGGEAEFSSQLVAIPSEVVYRPERKTPRPLVEGTQLGLVVGSSEAEIETDEYGRIKVRFRWDRETEGDETSSCWIPVAQPWAGSNWGFLAIPRVGQEVVVDFLSGNPDKPIVVGSVYNGEQMPAQTLEQDKSRMTLRSQSLGGSGGFNEITLDDKENKEELFMQAERNMRQTVKANRSRSVGGSESVGITKDRDHDVGKSETVTVGENREVTVSKNVTYNTGVNLERTTVGSETRTVGVHSTLTVTKNSDVTINGDEVRTLAGHQTLTVGKNSGLTVTGDLTQKAVGEVVLEAIKGFSIESKDEIKLVCGDSSLTLKSDGTIELKGKQLLIKGASKMDLKSDGQVSVKGSMIKMN